MEAIPAVIVQAKANLQRPPQIYTQTAIEQTQGAISFVREGLAPLLDRAPDAKKSSPRSRKKPPPRSKITRNGCRPICSRAPTGDFRLGAEKFRKKLHFALASDMPMEEVMARAQADLKATQAAIYETALPLYKQYFPEADAATLADKHKVTAAVLDKLAEEHPDNNTIVDYAKKVVGGSDRIR